MNACATALREGVPLAIHSDAPVTPLGPLFTIWCAANLQTPSGRILGAHERIGAADALRMITLRAAYTLKLDDEIGSIECGKRADFAVLEDDPTETSDADLKDVGIWGVVLGGRLSSPLKFSDDSALNSAGHRYWWVYRCWKDNADQPDVTPCRWDALGSAR